MGYCALSTPSPNFWMIDSITLSLRICLRKNKKASNTNHEEIPKSENHAIHPKSENHDIFPHKNPGHFPRSSSLHFFCAKKRLKSNGSSIPDERDGIACQMLHPQKTTECPSRKAAWARLVLYNALLFFILRKGTMCWKVNTLISPGILSHSNQNWAKIRASLSNSLFLNTML